MDRLGEKMTGSTHISERVLMDLAGYAALESYGVVGMVNPSLKDEVVQLLPKNKLRKGVRLTRIESDVMSPSEIEIDLYVVIEYGTNLQEVSRNLADRVRYVLSEYTDVSIGRIDVHVLEIKVR